MFQNESAFPPSTPPPIDASERALARKHGVRELAYPDAEQSRALARYLAEAVETRRSGAVPKTTVLMMVDFLQGILNRQFLTKSPTMAFEEYEVLQVPYHLASRIVTQILYDKRELAASRGKIYQTTHLRLRDFIELLRNILDPGCPWLRRGTIPDDVIEQMDALHDFVARYPEARRQEREERARHAGRGESAS